jgi:hypothetical protein
MFIETVKDVNSFLTISKDRISSEKFLLTKPVHCQRLEEPRHKSVKKILEEKLLPTHLEVAVINCLFEDDYYKRNQMYSVNGNTRKYIWLNYPDLRPYYDLYVTVYNVRSKEEIEQIYRSIDSSNSVESTGQMIGGLFRSMSYAPKSLKFVGGNIGMSLKHAYASVKSDRGIYRIENGFNSIKSKTEFNYFINELCFIDSFYEKIQNNKDLRMKYRSNAILAALLIISKKHGIDNPKLYEMIEKLFNNVITVHEGVNGLNDGISIIAIDLYDKHNKIGEWTKVSAGYGPVIIGKFVYCMDAYMNNVLLKIRSSSSTKGIVLSDEKSIEFFMSYFQK